MKLYVDLETLQLIEGPGFRNPVSSLRFKRGDAARLEVVFLQDATTPTSIGDPASLELQFGIKPRGRYDVDYLVHESVWTLPAPGAQNPSYICSPSFNTVQLDSAMQVGSATGTELAEIQLMGEITWREGAGDPTSTRTFLITVENDVNRGTEGVPDDAVPAYPAPGSIELVANKGTANGYAPLDPGGLVPIQHLPSGPVIDASITALTGGLNSLEAVPTVDLPPYRVLGMVIGGVLSFYQLLEGEEETDLPGTIQPADFDQSVPPRYWLQVL